MPTTRDPQTKKPTYRAALRGAIPAAIRGHAAVVTAARARRAVAMSARGPTIGIARRREAMMHHARHDLRVRINHRARPARKTRLHHRRAMSRAVAVADAAGNAVTSRTLAAVAQHAMSMLHRNIQAAIEQ